VRTSSFRSGKRALARLLLVALINQWTAPLALAAQTQAQEPAPLPQASTITSIADTETTTFIDTTLIGKDESELVGKWVRVFTEDEPAGRITQITAFDGETGEITLQDPLPAGAVEVNDVYHLADDKETLLPTNFDPSTILSGSVGCAPAGTDDPDEITCFAIDATGVDAKKGDDQVDVTSPTILVVTKFGSDKKDENEAEDESEEENADAKSEAKAVSLGEGNDQIVNDGTIVSAAIAVVSETPKKSVRERRRQERRNQGGREGRTHRHRH
jgi:hypothetical protein